MQSGSIFTYIEGTRAWKWFKNNGKVSCLIVGVLIVKGYLVLVPSDLCKSTWNKRIHCT